MTLFATIAVFLTLVSIGLVVRPLLRAGSNAHPAAATLTALATPALVLMIYLSVSNFDWRAPDTAAPSPGNAAPGSVEEAVKSLEQKLQNSPQDEEGWILLGSSYLSLNRPVDAVKAYQQALDLSAGRNVAARLGLAEARVVLDPGALSGAAGEDIEAVLQAEPRNPKALWYGGLRALARSEPAVARERWRALLELAPPERVRQIIETQLADLDASLAASPGPADMPAPKAATGPNAIGITVSVSERLREKVSATAPLFVFVRDAETAGPPLAVIRRQASDLPVTIQISDADVMLPGRSLESVQSATLVARVANGGDPIARPGDVFGEARWKRGEASGTTAILIDQLVAQ